MTPPDLAISMTRIRKTFGPKVAVEGLDLAIPRGSMVGLIGPNGAGKTTSIRMIMSILFPDSGELSVLGKRSALESKDRIGYLPEERGVYKKMKVGPFLRHMGRLKGLPAAGLDDAIRGWLEKIELPEVWSKKCEELSKGMQQKVQFVASVLHEPELVILDEPFSGLDPVNMRLLRDLIGEQHADGRTIIFSTHVMAQAEALCDHIVMIHQGQKVMDDSLAEIRGRNAVRAIAFEPADGAGDAVPGVGAIDEVRAIRPEGVGFIADLHEHADPTAALGHIAAATAVSKIELVRPSLEDMFIEIVTGGSGDAEGGGEADLRAMLRTGSPAAEPVDAGGAG